MQTDPDRIGQYYKTNKLVFLLFLLGGITCAITFIFFYSNILAPVKAEGRENAIYRTYVITFESSKHRLRFWMND